MSGNNKVPATGRTLWIIIVVSLAIHLLSLLAGRIWLQDWRWAHHPVHSAVEMTGALIAIMVAWMLLSLQRRGEGTSFNIWIAGALVGMGLLDGFHALVHAGNTFVWLHSTATFAGGVLFACVWLPRGWAVRMSDWWPHCVLILTAAFAAASILLPDHVPLMVENERFTLWAMVLNVVGGLLLFAAAAQLVRTYLQHRNVDDLLFCLHCSLFGAAALMFEQSRLWDLPWWGWHLLRLMAYGVAMWFIVLTERRTQHNLVRAHDELKDFSATLELRVAERTEQLKEYAEQLERSNIDLQRFAYVASHDLQEPLRSVGGFCSLLQRRYGQQLDETANEWIARAVEGAERMSKLIRDLLEYSRIDTEVRPFESVSLAEVVEETVGALRGLVQQSQATIHCDELPVVQANRLQMRQVFQNLIGNAIKFRGDDAPHVNVSACKNETEWTISVSDNGIGVDSESGEAIFDVFKRLHPHDDYPGTGVGLAICRRVVERHGGRIWVDTGPARGSTFHFTLPIANDNEDAQSGDRDTPG
ncbi:MAG: ATP-binding protein [Planctomycetota bacterium]|nr:ATP-binding protein [Planctomycetota bacterium]